jgi:hypothetical protein
MKVAFRKSFERDLKNIKDRELLRAYPKTYSTIGVRIGRGEVPTSRDAQQPSGYLSVTEQMLRPYFSGLRIFFNVQPQSPILNCNLYCVRGA